MKMKVRKKNPGLIWLCIILFAVTPSVDAATWYIDAISGDDAYDGTTPVYVSGIAGPFKTIMYGVLQASPGDTLRVAAGSYFEQVQIDRALVILGNNEGIWGTGTRSTESVLYPPGIDITPFPSVASSILTIQSSDVVIRGFEFNGDNGSQISGNLVNGADVDMASGIFIDGPRDRVFIENNRLLNLMYFGIVAMGNGIGVAGGNEIRANYLGNYSPDAYAISCINDFYANISFNTVRTVSYAIQIDAFAQLVGDPWSINDNDLQCFGTAIGLSNFKGSTDDLTIKANLISAPIGFMGNEGISGNNLISNGSLNCSGNVVSRFFRGISIQESSPQLFTMGSDSIKNCDYGLWWSNNFAAASSDTIAINSVVFTDNAQVAISVISDPHPLALTLSNSQIRNSDNGLNLEGDVKVVPSNLSFVSVPGMYIRFGTSASGNTGSQDVDAKSCLFEGLTGAVMTESQCFSTEDKLHHYPDNQDFPHINFKQNFMYVTGVDGNDSIQPALDKIPTGGQVVVKAITTSENLQVDKTCTITASGLVTIRGLKMNAVSGQLDLQNELQVADSLQLAAGLVNTSAGRLTLGILNVKDPVFIGQGTPSSYVEGALRVVNISSTSDTLYFPIGKTFDFRPMRMVIQHSSSGTPASYQAELINSAPTGNPTEPTLSHISTKRYWLVTQNGSPAVSDVKYTLSYGMVILNDEVTDPANLRVALLEGTTWLNLGGSGSAPGSGLIGSNRAYNKFGALTLANAKGGSNALGHRGPSAEFSTSGSCAVDSFSFTDLSTTTGDPIVKRHWDFGIAATNGDTSDQINPKWLFTTPGIYTVKLVVTTSAGDRDSITHDVTSFPSPQAGFQMDIPCAPENIVFSDTSRSNGIPMGVRRWFLNDTLQFGSALLQLYAPATGNHKIKLWLENSAGCRDSAEQDLYYGDSIKLSITPGRNISKCSGDSVTITVNGTARSFLWNSGDTTKSITLLNPGKYVVRAENSNFCFASDSASITDETTPVADAGPDLSITLGEHTTIGGLSTPAMNYRWTPAEGLSDATLSNPTAGPAETTKYILRVFNNIGCDSYDTMVLTINRPTVMVIPNLISPNGDGANDTWNLSAVPGISKSKVAVFSRWGQIVYESADYQHDWDGTNDNGDPLPEGTYVYIIEFGTPGLGIAKGNLQIIR